ncbi:glycosyltransferase [Rheinheimera tilapiae]|uniref:Glycosyltransferase n=1 Tax=Rheinheimera tilapiae TaxID=875043 RepID=A0ABV6BGX6_9GAMM
MPLVTVYIPTRNRLELLLRAIQSCLAQSFADFEIIVVDDASDQSIRGQIAAIADLDPRIKVMQLDVPQGACAARNLAISHATGKYLTGLDDDDEFMPQRLQQLLNAYQQHPRASFVSSGYLIKAASGQMLTSSRGEKDIALDDLLYANVIGNQVMTTTEAMRAIGGFDINLPSCQDYDTWIRLVEKFGSGYRSAEISYIVHQDHGSQRISSHVRRKLGYEYLYNKHQHLMNEQQRASQLFYRLLYTENPSLLQILKAAPRSQLMVALKVYLLRKIGYDI